MALARAETEQQTMGPEQLRLFGGVDMARLRAKVVEMTSRRAPSTARAYASDLRDFEGWCAMAGRASLPASEDTVTLYTAHALESRSVSTQTRRLAAIVAAHRAVGAPNPVTAQVRSVLSGARRAGALVPRGKSALTVDQLRSIVKALPKSTRGIRDRAVLLFGFASGLRRSEIAALDLDDIQVSERGVRVTVRRSKTDQESRGRELGVFAGKRAATCPLTAMKAWLRVRGKAAGPLFYSCDGAGKLTYTRLLSDGVHDCVKRGVRSIGLDASRYGGHSLRAGMVTAAAEAGVPESMIMQTTGHKSIAMVARYVRPARLWAYNPLARAL